MANLSNAMVYDDRSAESIAAFIETLGGKVRSFEGTERRAHARFVVAIPSVIQPLNEQQEPTGRSFAAATRDISCGGIGLLHSEEIVAKFIDVRLQPPGGREGRFLVRVSRCRPLGAYFDIAGEFVTADD